MNREHLPIILRCPCGRQNTYPLEEFVLEQHELKRDLKNRHVQLIAIGGTIGTGLFLGSGKAISLAGPSIIIGYLIVGIALFFVMRALGELLLSKGGYASFTEFATEYLGDWAGYVTGWTYWFCWIMTAMADTYLNSYNQCCITNFLSYTSKIYLQSKNVL